MEEEIWKDIPEFGWKYQISNFGNIRSWINNYQNKRSTPKNLIVGKRSGKYLYVDLLSNRTIRKRYIHELVLEAFVGKPIISYKINHIDKNVNNNHLSNLEYILDEYLKDEIWMSINKFERYECSDNGRIRRTANKRGNLLDIPILMSQYFDKDGYLRIALSQNGKSSIFYVHRLVASYFIKNNDELRTQINHKDGNKSNNKIYNLEWVTPLENIKHSIEVLGVKIIQDKTTGRFIGRTNGR